MFLEFLCSAPNLRDDIASRAVCFWYATARQYPDHVTIEAHLEVPGACLDGPREP
jgi:hypothetical protein